MKSQRNRSHPLQDKRERNRNRGSPTEGAPKAVPFKTRGRETAKSRGRETGTEGAPKAVPSKSRGRETGTEGAPKAVPFKTRGRETGTEGAREAVPSTTSEPDGTGSRTHTQY
jgi:hypothetical protein